MNSYKKIINLLQALNKNNLGLTETEFSYCV